MASRRVTKGAGTQVCCLQIIIKKQLLPEPRPWALAGPADELPPSPHLCPPSHPFCLGFPVYTTGLLRAPSV